MKLCECGVSKGDRDAGADNAAGQQCVELRVSCNYSVGVSHQNVLLKRVFSWLYKCFISSESDPCCRVLQKKTVSQSCSCGCRIRQKQENELQKHTESVPSMGKKTQHAHTGSVTMKLLSGGSCFGTLTAVVH